MRKLLFYVITVPLVIATLFGVLVFFNENEKTEVVPKKEAIHEKEADVDVEKYGGEVLQVGGEGSRIHQVTAHLVTEHGYLTPPEDWISVGFNNSGNLIHVNCKKGYITTSCNVNDKDISVEETTGSCVAVIEERIKNKVVIACDKK
jgi:hypothetical protein